MRKYIVISIAVALTVITLNGCKMKRGSCAEGEVMDERTGIFASPSYGLCIPNKVIKTNDKGKDCWGYEVPTGKKDANGNPIKECITGCTEGNAVDGKCISNLDMGKPCNLTSDCKDNGVCFNDPQIFAIAAASKGEAMANAAKSMYPFCTKSCKVNSDCAANFICDPNNYCSPDPNAPKPDADATEPDKDEPKPDTDTSVPGDADEITADTDSVLDEDTVLPDEGPTAPKCLEKTCATHADCKDDCDADFCIPSLAAGAGATKTLVCTTRGCTPGNNATCPDGMECVDLTPYASMIDTDGATSICAWK